MSNERPDLAVVIMAGFFPPGVGEDMDPLKVAQVTSIPWYLRAPHAFVARGPIGTALLGLLYLVLYFLPRLDRSTGVEPRSRVVVLLGAFVLLASFVSLSLGWLK